MQKGKASTDLISQEIIPLYLPRNHCDANIATEETT